MLDTSLRKPIIKNSSQSIEFPLEFNRVKELKNFDLISTELGKEKFRTILQILYYDLGLSINTIAKAIDVYPIIVSKWFKALEIPVHPVGERIVRSHLVLFKPPSATGKNLIQLTEELAYFIGFVIGDGYTDKKKGLVEAINTEFSIKRPIKRVMTSVGKVRELQGVTVKGNRYWRLQVSDVALARLFSSNSINFILNNPRFAKQLIAGFYDADGLRASQYHKSGTPLVGFINQDKSLLNSIKMSLLNCYNIRTVQLVRDEQKGRSHVIRGRVIKSKKSVFKFYISAADFVKFAELILPLIKHTRRMKSIKMVLKTRKAK